jgi:hypothetical protein
VARYVDLGRLGRREATISNNAQEQLIAELYSK